MNSYSSSLPQAAASGSEEESSSSNILKKVRPYLRTFKRRSIIIGTITIAVGVLGFILGSPGAPTYSGGFRMLVEPVSGEAKLTDPTAVARGVIQDTGRLDYATQLEILTGPKMFGEVADQVQQQFPSFDPGTLWGGVTVERYVGEAGDTRILQVRYTGEDPEVVKYVLEVIASKYLRYSLQERKSRIGEGVKFIEDQLPDLQARVGGLQEQLRQLQRRYQMLNPETQGGNLLARLNTITTLEQDTLRQLQEQQALYSALSSQLQFSPEEAVVAAALSENPNYQTLLGEIAKLDADIALALTRFQPNSPDVIALQEQRASLMPVLNAEASQVASSQLGTLGNPQVMAFQGSIRLGFIQQLVEADNTIRLLTVRSQDIARTKQELEQQILEFPEIAGRYNELRRELDIATRTLDQLLVQRETLRVEAAQSQVPWEILNQPFVPRGKDGLPRPDAPDRKKQMVGVVLGVILGLGAAVLWEKYRDIYYTTEDVEDAFEFPLLGSIPYYSQAQVLSDAADSHLTNQADSTNVDAADFLHAFDVLYSNLKLLFFNPPRSIAVCSAEAKDGKSTVALHLAQAAASMGQRVLLVDGNLRLPDIHDRLMLSNTKGLSDFLVNHIDPHYLIQQSKIAENLYVLPSGQSIPGSAKLLASTQMQDLKAQLERQFDLIIYDTPDLLGPLDANFLATHTDGILMVIGVRETKQSSVGKVLSQLEKYHLPVLGTIANHPQKDKVFELPEGIRSQGKGMWGLPEFGSAIEPNHQTEPSPEEAPAPLPINQAQAEH